jgi:dTDP-4-dehydrorhamnose 3,5-epimerase
MMSVPFAPEFSTGIRWNDPSLNIPWPIPDPHLSEKDRKLSLLAPADGA